MGRPPVIPAEKKTQIVLSVLSGEVSIAEAARKERVPADLRDRLSEEARRRGTTTSELVRRALEEYLAS